MKTYRKGTTVVVLNTSMSGTLFIEGHAVVLSHRKDGRYTVKFANGDIVDRFIDPEAQHGNAGRYVADINAGLLAATEHA